jgi:hypothetical protein
MWTTSLGMIIRLQIPGADLDTVQCLHRKVAAASMEVAANNMEEEVPREYVLFILSNL